MSIIASLNLAGAGFESRTLDEIKRFVMRIDRRIVNATPVDTGRARSNWIVSVDSPTGQTDSAPADPAARSAISDADREIAAIRQIPNKIYLQNNLDYIQKLNNGSSIQAQPGYVQAAITATSGLRS